MFVAGVLDCLQRKGFIDGLGFLQADDVGIAFLHHAAQIVDAQANGIDVPGENFHLLKFIN